MSAASMIIRKSVFQALGAFRELWKGGLDALWPRQLFGKLPCARARFTHEKDNENAGYHLKDKKDRNDLKDAIRHDSQMFLTLFMRQTWSQGF